MGKMRIIELSGLFGCNLVMAISNLLFYVDEYIRCKRKVKRKTKLQNAVVLKPVIARRGRFKFVMHNQIGSC